MQHMKYKYKHYNYTTTQPYLKLINYSNYSYLHNNVCKNSDRTDSQTQTHKIERSGTRMTYLIW